MSVGTICSQSVVTAGANESIREAARRMARLSVGTLVVTDLDQGERPIGILTDRDIVTRCIAAGLDPDNNPVSSIMSVPVRSVGEDTPVADALSIMAGGGMRRLVVTNAQDRLVGILALDDVIELLVKEADAVGRLLLKATPAAV
jgi:predicted transcriptional regulator